MVTTAPETLTSLVTLKTSTCELLALNNVIFPVPTLTYSSKVKVISAADPIPVALSAGELEERVGAIISAAVKLSVVASLIPAYELALASSKAVAAI